MKKFLLMFLTAVFCMPLMVNAQLTATFGTGTSASQTGGSAGGVLSSGTLFSYSQEIYTAAELTSAGVPAGAVITSIAFSNGTGTNTTMHGIHVYMGHRSTTSFSGTTDYTPFSDLVRVDSADWVTTTYGWITRDLATPFVWNGVDNLVIGVCYSGASSSGSNCGWYYTTQSESRQWRRYLSYTNAGAENCADPSYTGTSTPGGTAFNISTSTNRPNLQITYILSGCASIPPRWPTYSPILPTSAG